MKNSLLFKVGFNLILSVLVVVGLVYLVKLDRYWPVAIPPWIAGLGWIIILVGLAMILTGEYALITHGGATGSPFNPTHRLVTAGIYRWLRNPIYLGVLIILFGAAVFRSSLSLLVLTLILVVGFHLWVIKVEEPYTLRRFGSSYGEYLQAVPRWFPHRP
jgi:protein-S-isoprenylcysteine O-methyltransferase Ste14